MIEFNYYKTKSILFIRMYMCLYTFMNINKIVEVQIEAIHKGRGNWMGLKEEQQLSL